jgi:hypothetical protein
MRKQLTPVLAALLIVAGCGGGSGGAAASQLDSQKLKAATSVHIALTLTASPLQKPNAIQGERLDGWLGRSDTQRFRYDYRETVDGPTLATGKPFQLSGEGRSSGGKYAFRIGWFYQNWVCDPAPNLDLKLVAEPLVAINQLHDGAMPSSTIATWFDHLYKRIDTVAFKSVPDAPPGRVTIITAGGYPTAVIAEFTARTPTGGEPLPPQRFTIELHLDHWNGTFATPRPPSPRNPGILDEVNSTAPPGPNECS